MKTRIPLVALTATWLIAAWLPGRVPAATAATSPATWEEVRHLPHDCPIIYDNDWLKDTCDDEYLFAKARLGQANLRGLILTKDEWDGGKMYTVADGLRDFQDNLAVVCRAGWTGIPEVAVGADRMLTRPADDRIEATTPIRSPGTDLIVREARRASPGKPLVVIVGGPLLTVASAYLTDPLIADRMVVLMTDLTGYNGPDPWANFIVATRCKLVNFGASPLWWPQRPAPAVMPLDRFDALPDSPITHEIRRVARMFWERSTRTEKPDRDDGFADGAGTFLMFAPESWVEVKPVRVTKAWSTIEVKDGGFHHYLDAVRINPAKMTEEFFGTLAAALGATRPEAPYPARVSENHRFLIDQVGKPFFYLGDTAWELFHRLGRDEADHYLQDRAAQRFNVIQAVVLAEFAGLVEANAQGHLPLVDNDPARPVEAYFADVDWVVNRANELGLCVGMLPTWGDKWNKKWGQGPEIFTPQNARVYGEFLGDRYRNKSIVWILGGDRPIESDRHREIIRAMAEGLRAGDGGRHMITYHPAGGHGSADWLHDEPWLDFNMCQTGHGFNHENFKRIAADYARKPVKPCLDAEPGYEDHPAEFNAKNGYLDAYESRKFAYWSVFAGACGHTYGCHDIWQFYAPERSKPITAARTPWREALRLPGSRQMKFLRALIESRPMLDRVPDPTLIVGDAGNGTDRIAASRGGDGSYALIYASSGRPFTVDLGRLSGERLRAWWFDCRTGEARESETFPKGGSREFRPPSQGKGLDWVLVIDDVARNFPSPGTKPH